ncbi:uncharacterized protein LOC116033335 [Ipomoea triloba]|uniref:uncharacterized protein LOC116033335 n=1 Tax=Ipomoea triloba TaxID=35885 RepID=UPI00125D1196|nr:uncharacterized protein LOC116033335 [Ipomoea triloba]
MPWIQSLIIKLWGKTVGYNYLLRKLKSMWRINAHFDLVTLENDYFLVRFSSVSDYAFAKQEGPWMILDHYLVVKEWSPNFDPTTDKTENLLVWVRFPCLPIEYFNFRFLEKVGKKIGRPIKADMNTSTGSRGRFARILVEVDISKPLLSKFKLKKRIRIIEYEGLHLVCFRCGIYGRRKETCPTKNKNPEAYGEEGRQCGTSGNKPAGKETVWKTTDSSHADNTPTVIRPEVTEGYGSWMLAKRKERRFVQGSSGRQQASEASGNNRKSKHGTNEGGSGRENNPHVKPLGQSSRFGVLYGLDDPTEQMEPTYVEKTKSGLTNQGTFRDKGKKPVKQPTREHSDIDTDKALPKDKSGRNGGNYKGESSGTKTGNYKGESSGTKTRPKSRQAAAETEHTLVIGSRGGETVRYTVQEDIPPNESDWAMEEWGDWREHPNDPPHYGALEDDMEEEYFVEYG